MNDIPHPLCYLLEDIQCLRCHLFLRLLWDHLGRNCMEKKERKTKETNLDIWIPDIIHIYKKVFLTLLFFSMINCN